jgi:hypothetical protein
MNQLRKKVEDDSKRPKFIVIEPWIVYRFLRMSEALRTVPFIPKYVHKLSQSSIFAHFYKIRH